MCCFYILVAVQPQDSTASRLHTFEYRISENSFLPSIVSAATIQFMKQIKIAIMRKLYEKIHIKKE